MTDGGGDAKPESSWFEGGMRDGMVRALPLYSLTGQVQLALSSLH